MALYSIEIYRKCPECEGVSNAASRNKRGCVMPTSSDIQILVVRLQNIMQSAGIFVKPRALPGALQDVRRSV